MVIFLLTLVGIAASVLLLFGATWARWITAFIALVDVIGAIGTVAGGGRLELRHFPVIVSVITLVIVIGWAANIFHF